MPNKKISDLPAAGAAALTDLYETTQAGTSKQETLLQMQTAMTGKQNVVAYTSTHFGFFDFTGLDHVYTNATGKPVFIEYHVNFVPDVLTQVYQFFVFRGSDGGTEFPVGITTSAAADFTELNWHGMWVVNAGDTLTFQVGFAPNAGDAIKVEYFETRLF